MTEQPMFTSASAEGPTDSSDAALVQLERQVERGSLFTHTALGANQLRLKEVESFAYGLIDALLAKGVLSFDEVNASVDNVRQKLIGEGEGAGVGVALRVEADDAAQHPVAEIDCAARLHICHAACCKLDFALSTGEVEAGRLKWDLGRPYFIRRGSDGHCAHIDRATDNCGVYEHRPSVCRGYSCADDKRIWKDFEKMELNDEWLTKNLSPSRPRALKVLMHDIEPRSTVCAGEPCEIAGKSAS